MCFAYINYVILSMRSREGSRELTFAMQLMAICCVSMVYDGEILRWIFLEARYFDSKEEYYFLKDL
jgi:hypothetical protein